MQDEFSEFIDYCRKLEFEQEPDYEFLTNLLKKVLKNNCEISNPDFDWNYKLKSNSNYECNNDENKHKNKSMLLNISTISHVYFKDETGISRNFLKINGNSIFHKNDW